MNKRLWSALGFSTMSITAVLYIISNILPSWVTRDSLQKTENGLWEICSRSDGQKICAPLRQCSASSLNSTSDVCVSLYGARAFLTIACILSVSTALWFLLDLLLSQTSQKETFFLVKILPMMCSIAGFIGIGFGILINVGERRHLSTAAISAVLGFVVNLVSGILILALQPLNQ